MRDLKIYDKLQQFPLFQGMSSDELQQVVGHTKFGFAKYESGKRIIREGDVCTHLHFLVGGELRAETQPDDRGYTVVERLAAPYLLQPERLFGHTQRYGSTFFTQTQVHFISIDKREVLSLMQRVLVFRLNMLGHYSTETQRLGHQPWRSVPKSPRERIIRFFFTHSLHPAGPKTFLILMQRLADELGISRTQVSAQLRLMQSEELLQLKRGQIVIPLLERLIM